MRTLALTGVLVLAACGPADAGSLGETAAVDAQVEAVRARMAQAERELAELVASRPAAIDDPTVPEVRRRTLRAGWKSQQVTLALELAALRLRLEALTGEPLLPSSVG